jgi:hypothetical protein
MMGRVGEALGGELRADEAMGPRPGGDCGERERRVGGGEVTAAERGDKGGDEVPGRPDLVVKPGEGCPASRRRGLCADRGSAPDEPAGWLAHLCWKRAEIFEKGWKGRGAPSSLR